jgi:hypothetical protein
MSKQTAVEWLIAQIKQTVSMSNKVYELEKQAKEIEREQIVDAYVNGCEDTYGQDEPNPNYPDSKYAQDYYTQTYGKKFLDLVSPETSQVHEVVRKLKEEKEVTCNNCKFFDDEEYRNCRVCKVVWPREKESFFEPIGGNNEQ